MTKSVAAKMGIKEVTRAIFIHASADDIKSIGPPTLAKASSLRGGFRLHSFLCHSPGSAWQEISLLEEAPQAYRDALDLMAEGKQQGTDLTLTIIIKIGYEHGLVESKTLSISSTWSGIKFTYPKNGKVYNNSYGKLKKELHQKI